MRTRYSPGVVNIASWRVRPAGSFQWLSCPPTRWSRRSCCRPRKAIEPSPSGRMEIAQASGPRVIVDWGGYQFPASVRNCGVLDSVGMVGGIDGAPDAAPTVDPGDCPRTPCGPGRHAGRPAGARYRDRSLWGGRRGIGLGRRQCDAVGPGSGATTGPPTGLPILMLRFIRPLDDRCGGGVGVGHQAVGFR